MPTNIKVKRIIIFLDNQDLKNQNILLLDDLRIYSGQIINVGNEIIFMPDIKHLDKKIECLNDNDLENMESINPCKEIDLIPRNSTKEEIELISKYNNTEYLKNINHTSYDVSPDFVFVFTNHIKLVYDKSGKTFVENFQEKYAIRYGVVVPYKEDEIFEDLEIDISDIKKFLDDK